MRSRNFRTRVKSVQRDLCVPVTTHRTRPGRRESTDVDLRYKSPVVNHWNDHSQVVSSLPQYLQGTKIIITSDQKKIRQTGLYNTVSVDHPKC